MQALEDAAVAAKRALDNPPDTVPVSIHTAFVVWPLTVARHAHGNDLAWGALQNQADIIATLTGMKDTYLAQGRGEGRKAAEEELGRRPVIIGDGNAGMSVHPPRLVRPLGGRTS